MVLLDFPITLEPAWCIKSQDVKTGQSLCTQDPESISLSNPHLSWMVFCLNPCVCPPNIQNILTTSETVLQHTHGTQHAYREFMTLLIREWKTPEIYNFVLKYYVRKWENATIMLLNKSRCHNTLCFCWYILRVRHDKP